MEKLFTCKKNSIWDGVEDVINKSILQVVLKGQSFENAPLRSDLKAYIHKSLENSSPLEKITHLNVEEDADLDNVCRQAVSKVFGNSGFQRSTRHSQNGGILDESELDAKNPRGKNTVEALIKSSFVGKPPGKIQDTKAAVSKSDSDVSESASARSEGERPTQKKVKLFETVLHNTVHSNSLRDLGTIVQYDGHDSRLDITPKHHLLNESNEKQLFEIADDCFPTVLDKGNWKLDEGVEFISEADSLTLKRNEMNDTFEHGKLSYALLKLPLRTKLAFRVTASLFWADFSNLMSNAFVVRLLEEPFGSLPFFLWKSDVAGDGSLHNVLDLNSENRRLGFGRLVSPKVQTAVTNYRKRGFTAVCPVVQSYLIEFEPGKQITVSLDESDAVLTGIRLAKEESYTLCVRLPFGSSFCRLSRIAEEEA